MARAEAAGPSMAKRLPLSRLGLPLRTGIPGHARLLAHPAYQKLLAAEPILRRLIPVLIVIFLAIVGLARLLELYEQKIDRENDARQAVALIAAAVSGGLAHAADPTVQHTLAPGQARDALAAALPDGATGDGRQIYLTDAPPARSSPPPRPPAMPRAAR